MNGSGPLVAWGGLINISVKVSKLIIFCLFFFDLVFEVGWIIWLRLTSDSRCSKMVLCACLPGLLASTAHMLRS